MGMIVFLIMFCAIVFFCMKMHKMTGNKFAGQGFILAVVSFIILGVCLFCLYGGILIIVALFPFIVIAGIVLFGYKIVRGFLGESNKGKTISPGIKPRTDTIEPEIVKTVHTYIAKYNEFKLVIHEMSNGHFSATITDGLGIGIGKSNTKNSAAQDAMMNAPFRITSAQAATLLSQL